MNAFCRARWLCAHNCSPSYPTLPLPKQQSGVWWNIMRLIVLKGFKVVGSTFISNMLMQCSTYPSSSPSTSCSSPLCSGNMMQMLAASGACRRPRSTFDGP
eukprot:1160123-Pelagomonas_calceolata.AAC.2